MSFRSKNRRLDVETLYILGAGASYGATLGNNEKPKLSTSPLDSGFCQEIISLSKVKRPVWVPKLVKEMAKYWKDHRKFSSFGLEESIIVQMGHLDFLDSIHKKRSIIYTEEKFLKDISHLICHFLKKSKENKNKYYEKLFHQIIGKTTKIEDCRNRVITFNYDTLLDTYFLNKYSPKRIYFDKIIEPDLKTKSKIKDENPLMLKLHGSLNWRCSNTEFQKIISPLSSDSDEDILRINDIKIDNSRLDPEDNQIPCIIPPLPNKPITKISLFKYLWNRAYEYLYEAENLVICGYSLPYTDNTAVALFSNFKNKNINSLKLIDPDPMILKKWKDLFKRSGVSIRTWQYYSSFQEYFGEI